MLLAQLKETAPVAVASVPTQSTAILTLPSWRRPNNPTCHDRSRQSFLDHWHRWHDFRLRDEIPPDQGAYVDEIIQRLMLCRNPDGGYVRYVCPGCEYELLVPFSCKTRFCPSFGKDRVDNWVNDVTGDLLLVPHLQSE